ncbi:hypothetical protein H0H93_016233 [Arthromyces matolae]|nr:hypothetical protein H0H93_016233 [Arthromyces matolae]
MDTRTHTPYQDPRTKRWLLPDPILFTFFMLSGSRSRDNRQWTDNWQSTNEQSTLVFRREDLQRIWKWEIASGHFPSSQPIPKQIGLKTAPLNPALPRQVRSSIKASRIGLGTEEKDIETYGVGPKRTYLDIQSVYPNVAYPPRPVPGSVADMDTIMKYCNFSAGKYVRDCLEILRVGGGLDNGRRTRRGNTDDWKYIYSELNATELQHDITLDTTPVNVGTPRQALNGAKDESDLDAGLTKKRNAEWETQVILPSPLKYRPSASLDHPCDSENPRIFHMFWTGPFTDKPYLALMSFLYTQNTGIHLKDWPEESSVCRPQFWLWINPGPAASVPNPSAQRDMFAQLKTSPWASPFLHPRFKDVIKFKLWNTTEQLDGIPEIKDEWRSFKTLFNSGGHVISVPSEKKDAAPSASANETTTTTTSKADDDDMLNRTGSKSSSSYDRLSVILSDMARFILCHRFGGIYLDADTIFLRDWEELWGWKGAFAYRWSRLEKYNTAVLKMHKGSALGTFLFRTALKNGLDFHPMSVSMYTADSFLEPLLLRLPDALFDSAWLNTENYQRDRPPQPYFTEFADFFETPTQNSAAPQALGFDGFFKGAYSYHFHNFWWKPFDTVRNWPDLGPRFKVGETAARAALKAALEAEKKKQNPRPTSLSDLDDDEDDEYLVHEEEVEEEVESVDDDKRDLDWSTDVRIVHTRGTSQYVWGVGAVVAPPAVPSLTSTTGCEPGANQAVLWSWWEDANAPPAICMIHFRVFPAVGRRCMTEANSSLTDSVVSAMFKFVTLANTMLKAGQGVEAWTQTRWEDFVISLQWLYDNHPNGQEALLIDTMERLKWSGVPWEKVFAKQWHGVNLAEGLKALPSTYRFTHNQSDLDVASSGWDLLFQYHGRPSGIYAADEYLAGLGAARGTELCLVVETMFSGSYLYQIIGDPKFPDRVERITYNALPGTLTGSMWSRQYLQQQNQIAAKNMNPDSLTTTITATSAFTYYVRIPSWVVGGTISINGGAANALSPSNGLQAVNAAAGKTSFVLNLPALITTVSRSQKVLAQNSQQPLAVDLEFDATEAWQYAIDPATLKFSNVPPASGKLPSPVFDSGLSPLSITVTACPISWATAGDTFASAPPTNPACTGAQKTLTLTPYGVGT